MTHATARYQLQPAQASFTDRADGPGPFDHVLARVLARQAEHLAERAEELREGRQ